MTDFANTLSQVYHMEPDKSYKHNILFSDGHSLRTTDGSRTSTEAGSATIEGYVEGSSTSARFSHISGFYQANYSHVLVVDHTNDCLRLIDRYRRQTSRFMGSCQHRPPTIAPVVDGRSATFFRPASVLNYKGNGKFLYLSEVGSSRVRIIWLYQGIVSTLIHSNLLTKPRFMTQDKDGYIYVTTDYAVVKLNVDQTYQKASATLIAGSRSSSLVIDGAFSRTFFSRPRGILAIGSEALVVADSMDNGCLRIMNLFDATTVSACADSSRTSAYNMQCYSHFSSQCSLNSPYSFLRLGDTIFLGENKRIRTIKCEFSSC